MRMEKSCLLHCGECSRSSTQGEPKVATTTPEDVNEGARPEDGEKKGRVEVDGGLPGQLPDVQVDEAKLQ